MEGSRRARRRPIEHSVVFWLGAPSDGARAHLWKLQVRLTEEGLAGALYSGVFLEDGSTLKKQRGLNGQARRKALAVVA